MVRKPIRMMRIGVKGYENLFTKASKNSPMNLSGGPGRTGRKLPARPRKMRTEPRIITMVSSII